MRGRAGPATRRGRAGHRDQRQPRLGAPARLRQLAGRRGRGVPADPGRVAGPAGAAGGPARAGRGLRGALPGARRGPGRPAASARAQPGPRRRRGCSAPWARGRAHPRGGVHPRRRGRPGRRPLGGHGARLGRRRRGERFGAGHLGGWGRPRARRRLRRVELRGPRPLARPADSRRADALQRLAAALLVLRGLPHQGIVAGRSGRGRRRPGRAGARACVPRAERHCAASLPTCSRPARTTVTRRTSCRSC